MKEAAAARRSRTSEDPGGTDMLLIVALVSASVGSLWAAVALTRYGNGSAGQWVFVGLSGLLGLAFAAGAGALATRAGRSAPDGSPGPTWYGPAGLVAMFIGAVLIRVTDLPSVVTMVLTIGGFQLTAFDSRFARQRRQAA